MANYKEEHIRNNRRLARQIVGGVALLLAVIGLFTVFGWVVSLLRSVLDDSDRRKARTACSVWSCWTRWLSAMYPA